MPVEELLEQIDIVDYISQFVELEEKNGEWWGISPFTDPPEKTPSFSVRRERHGWMDFSSGKAGNALTFTKFYFGCSGREAYEKLAAYAGLDASQLVPRHKLSATTVCRQFAQQKTNQKECTATKLPQNVMEQYDPDLARLQIWRDEGITDESLRKFQVRYDPVTNRIVYPIRNPDGTIVNIGCRTLDPNYKEKGLRKYSYLYKWGSIQTIYGLSENRDAILQKREIILFEGAKSVMKAHGWGVDNCGAILTSHLSSNQLKILLKLGVNVVFALDSDIDIRKDHNIEKLRHYCNVFYLWDRDHLLEEKDSPADRGEETFRSLYEGRLRYR